MNFRSKGWKALFSGAFAASLWLAPASLLAQAAPAPTGWWKLDEAAGATTAADSAGTDVATSVGQVAWGPGFVGPEALELHGTGCLQVPTAPIDLSQSYTVTAWVKVNHIGGFQTFLSDDGPTISGFFLQLRDDTQMFAFTVTHGQNGGENAMVSASDVPTPGQWYHLAGVYDAVHHNIALYVNGKLQQRARCSPTTPVPGPFVIGRGRFAGGAVDWVHGSIEDVRTYQSALTPAEIAAVAGPMVAKAGKLGEVVDSGPIPLTIHANDTAVHVSPTLYGLMTEEINHSYDGGIYAELIQNRIFKDNTTTPAHWSVVTTGGGTGTISLDNAHPINKALTTCLQLDAEPGHAGAEVGVANDGYWGVPLRPNTLYHVSFFARAAAGFHGALRVALEAANGSRIYASGSFAHLTNAWHWYHTTLKTGTMTASLANRFVITTNGTGNVYFNLVSVKPPTFNNRPNGTRPYIMKTLAAMKPAFLRLPGGNYLEGNTIKERFNWKKTLGPLQDRPGHQGPWGYRSSDGLGLLEYLEWCQDLHMQHVLAVYAGYSLQGQFVPPGPKLAPFVKSALEEIQYVTGPVTSKWGSVRAKDGHPAPFPLKYVEIGNEDFFDRSRSYDGRFAQFFHAIKAKYPHLQLIATTPVKSVVPDVIDEHYYMPPIAFEHAAHKYDTYSRTGPKIFVGEWASQEGRPTPDMNAALGDAAWMTGMERNSDIVVISSYAPLFVLVHRGAAQWGTNLIGYDGLKAYGSPSYWEQVMFGNYLGNVVPHYTLGKAAALFTNVTRNTKTGTVYIKLVNTADSARQVDVTLDGDGSIESRGTIVELTAHSRTATNSITDPRNVVPVTKSITGLGKKFTLHLDPLSVDVIVVKAHK
jgi:alpha-L-arabinofuranosidase